MTPSLEDFLKPTALLAVLLNPFLMSIYLLDMIESLDPATFGRTVARGSLIASIAFALFALGGDAIFSDVLQVRFASFLIFGGILFLLIGLRLAQSGPRALGELRGPPEHLAGSVAMPFMIGPGTVSASVLIGARLPPLWALLSIACAMIATLLGLVVVKAVHSRVRDRQAHLVERYVDIVARASALLVGTIAVDMVLSGLSRVWRQLG